ncbi:hypothetical protein STEG23_007483 [Scotinomys teguina]
MKSPNFETTGIDLPQLCFNNVSEENLYLTAVHNGQKPEATFGDRSIQSPSNKLPKTDSGDVFVYIELKWKSSFS